MIKTKDDYKRYLEQDALAARRMERKYFGIFDYVWKFQKCYRKCEYHRSFSKSKKLLFIFPIIWNLLKYKRLSLKLGFSIPLEAQIEEGFSIAHYGTVVIASAARIGKNCRMHEGVNIGATNGSTKAPVIGNNVFIGTGAKIIGDISIADDVAIGANAVVVKSITEPGTTWGGVPAVKISSNNSHSMLSPYLFDK